MTIQELIDAIKELTKTSALAKYPRPMGVVKKTRKKQDESIERDGVRYANLMSYYAHQIAQQSGDPCMCDDCLGLSEKDDDWVFGVGHAKQGYFKDKTAATRGKVTPSRQPPLDWPDQWVKGAKKTNPASNKRPNS